MEDGATLHDCVKYRDLELLQALLHENVADINATDKAGHTALLSAVLNRWEAGVSLLLERGADVEAKNSAGNTALYLACSLQHHRLVDLLLDFGANVNSCNCKRQTPLCAAVHSENLPLADKLLHRGADINILDTSGNILLSDYCKSKKKQMIRFLLDNGSDIESKNHSGLTPLMISCKVGNTDAIKELLSRRADVQCRDGDRNMALHFASCLRSTEIIQLLLDAGSDLEARNKNNLTPFAYAVRTLWALHMEPFGQGLIVGTYECVVLYLIQKGANVNVCDSDKMTPLLFAIEMRNLCLIRQLLIHGAEVNVQNNEQDSPLHYACRYHYFEYFDTIAIELIVYGAEVNVRNKKKETPLHIAAASRDRSSVIRLLKEGADVSLRDDKGNTPLLRVTLDEERSTSIINMLLRYGANLQDCNEYNQTLLMNAAYTNKCSLLDLFFTQEVNVNFQDIWGNTALHYASKFGDKLYAVEKLLSKGADVNIINSLGETPLLTAIGTGSDMDVIEVLLEHGSDINHKNQDGETALHHWICPKFVSLFLLKGCNLNAVDNAGNSPLHRCFMHFIINYDCILEYLIWGASVLIRNRDGVTPLGMMSRKFFKRSRSERYSAGTVIKKYIILSKAASLSLEPPLDVNLDIGFDHLSDFREKCLLEVDRMKDRWIGGNRVLDVLTKYRDPTYLSNSELQFFIVGLGQGPKEFPIYGSVLFARFHRAKRRQISMDKVQSLLHLPLPCELIREILSYLEDGQLDTLANSLNSEPK